MFRPSRFASPQTERTVKSLGYLNIPLSRYTRNKRETTATATPKELWWQLCCCPKATTENGFWHVSSDCQRTGHPRSTGRTTDEPPFYRPTLEVSSVNPC